MNAQQTKDGGEKEGRKEGRKGGTKAEGRQEGRKEGRKEGKEEGRKEVDEKENLHQRGEEQKGFATKTKSETN